MTSHIVNALEKGFTADQILDYVLKKFPSHKKKIEKALTSGFNASQILTYLSQKSSGKEDNELPTTEFAQMRSQDIKSQESRDKKALSTLMLAGTSLAAPIAATALQRALPSSLSGLLPALTAQTIGQNLSAIPPQQPPVNQVTPNIAQAQPVTQPEVKTINASEILNKHQSKTKVDELIKSGNGPQEIMGFFKKFYPQQAKDIEKESGMPFEKVVEQYTAQAPKAEEKLIEAEKPKIEKTSIVASPQGVGEVKEIRNGQALVDVDGKLHKVEEKNLLKPPKEAAIEAMELIKSFTPEAMRSTHHMLNSYDEEEEKGFFVFHNGSAYVVDDISPEEYKELSEEIEQAKTTGETIIGKWAAGEGSRGAGYNKIVKGVRDRKVVPELKKKFRKLKVGYNLLAEWQRLLNEKD